MRKRRGRAGIDVRRLVSARMHGTNPEQSVFPSNAPPGPGERQLALVVVLASAGIFLAAVPFARVQLPQTWAFIPIYQSALAIIDLITAALLFAQFWVLGTRALFALACGYVFTAVMVVAHTLTFPGLFAPTGLLGAGPQTTAWLYMFWHGGFPIFVIAYALLKDDRGGPAAPPWLRRHALPLGTLAVVAGAAGLTLLATAGEALLPAIMTGNSYTPAMVVVVPTVWALSFVALLVLWTRPGQTMIDLWLTVVMCIWIFDIGLSAVLNAGRFDLGFYAGRIYGLLATSLVLFMLLAAIVRLYTRLARALEVEQQGRRRESGLRRRIFDTSLDLILVCDRSGNLARVSPSCQAILGYQPDEMIGQNARQFLYRDDLGNARNEMRIARHDRHPRRFDSRYVHKDGHVVPLSWTGVWSERDQQHFFIGRDMTERLHLERQLREAQKMEAIGQLTGGVAHDFNNILAVIIGMTELTAAGVAGDAKLSAMVKQIDEAAERGAQLVQRMLALARKQPLEARILDVNEAVKHAADVLDRTVGQHITLQTSLAPDLWPTLVDPSQLQDAIVNLAVNARDAMPKGGDLVIETANVHLDEAYAASHADVSAGDYVAIFVTDSGTGMPPEVIERAFEPFFTTKAVGHGTGLGLSMVYGFVKQSGGHVKIYSEVGHGTSVKMYLPKAERRADPSRPAHLPEPEPERGLPRGRETILVVEDDATVRKTAVTTLEELGYRIHEAPDGKSAIDFLSGGDHIDLLFTDVIMPNGVSGRDLVEAARRLRPEMKALLTSGYSEQPATRRDGNRSVRLLRKPYRREKLATTIRSILDGDGNF